MDRREAISAVSLILGGTVIGAGSYLAGCKPKKRKSLGLFDPQLVKSFEELAEVILPKSNGSPGAKDVEIGKFMKTYVSDCYNAQEQKIFFDGILKLDEQSDKKFSSNFRDLTREQKHELVDQLEDELVTAKGNKTPDQPIHYYAMMKQLTLMGYLTSELVGTKVFRHIPVPGRFDACIPYKKGEKVFI